MRAASACALALALRVASGSTIPDVEDGRRLIAERRTEEGLAKLEQAAPANPGNAHQARSTFVAAREALVVEVMRQVEAARSFGDLAEP